MQPTRRGPCFKLCGLLSTPVLSLCLFSDGRGPVAPSAKYWVNNFDDDGLSGGTAATLLQQRPTLILWHLGLVGRPDEIQGKFSGGRAVIGGSGGAPAWTRPGGAAGECIVKEDERMGGGGGAGAT